ncbi:MAG TPA: hypothetical protein VF395_16700 [Polyangiaceae bacterium]
MPTLAASNRAPSPILLGESTKESATGDLTTALPLKSRYGEWSLTFRSVEIYFGGANPHDFGLSTLATAGREN